jgi:hypothetical protein
MRLPLNGGSGVLDGRQIRLLKMAESKRDRSNSKFSEDYGKEGGKRSEGKYIEESDDEEWESQMRAPQTPRIVVSSDPVAKSILSGFRMYIFTLSASVVLNFFQHCNEHA